MTFTEQYYFDEVLRFREGMGNKQWWEKTEEQRDAWIKGLALVYLNIENETGLRSTPEQIDKWATIFEATCVEYERRKTYMKLMPRK